MLSMIRMTRSWLTVLLALLLVALGIAVRLPHLWDSLWYDEMTTLLQYVMQPWGKVLAAGAGEYVPNNHVLHTVLVKLIFEFDQGRFNEAMLRVPAMVAGLLVPIALVWPLRKSEPLLALVLGMVAMVHPWLVGFNTEARGYSMMLLFGIVATHCLLRRPVVYVIAMVLAIYTVPLAVMLLPAHAVAVGVVRPRRIMVWAGSAAIVVLMSLLLYLPMGRGLVSYYSHPYQATLGYREFLDQLPRFAFLGDGNSRAAVTWALPVMGILIGTVLGWQREALRPMLVTFAAVSVMGLLFPLVMPGATEVRFVPWVLPWFCVAMVSLFLAPTVRWARVVGFLGLIGLVVLEVRQSCVLLPNQEIQRGIWSVDLAAPKDRDVMVLYLGAREAIAVYGDGARHHLLAAPTMDVMTEVEKQSLERTGHLPWVVIFYEKLAFDRNFEAGEAKGLWTELVTRYHLANPRLPGRVSDVAVYAPNN